MKETPARSSAAEHRPAGPTPLESSWAAAAVLMVWLGTFAAVSLPGDGGSVGGVGRWGSVGPAVIYAGSAVLIGLAAFLPARTSAAATRMGLYTLPVLSALAAAGGTAWFGLLGYGTGWSPDLGVLFAFGAWMVALIPTAVLLGLGYVERFDTAEYPSRAERLRSAAPGQP